MHGLDAQTGQALAGAAHLRQSVRDILATPIGSRVMRRTYGSDVFSLVDAPLNADMSARIVAAAAEALDRWEPRLRVRRIRVAAATAGGHLTFDIEGDVLPEGTPLALDGVLV